MTAAAQQALVAHALVEGLHHLVRGSIQVIISNLVVVDFMTSCVPSVRCEIASYGDMMI